MKVDYETCRTVDEELEYVEKQFEGIGNFFACDVHPNEVKAYKRSFKKLWNKRRNLIHSPEYQYYQVK
jgi:hypothetical protein